MWNKRYEYQDEYDDWGNQGTTNRNYPRNSKNNRTYSSVNYCPSCGTPINTLGNSQYPRRQYNQDERRYNQTYQSRSSCSSVLVPIAVFIAFIIIIASCSAGSYSAFSNSPSGQDVNIKYNNDIPSPESESVAYQISEPMSSAEVKVQEVNQPYGQTSRTYVVKSGDTLYRIAVEMLGDGSRWVEIDRLNNLGRLSNGSVLIHPGQVLILPDQ